MASKITIKKWKEVNEERKTVRKSWKEKKLLKKAGLIKTLKENKEKSENLDITVGNCPNTDQNTNKTLPTVSIAVPGSILANAQSQELRTYLAGQIARAACIYNIDEIVVFNDAGDNVVQNAAAVPNPRHQGHSGMQSCHQLAMVLQYLECPQYLRKRIFPIHADLQYAGLLNPLDAPHHLRIDDNCAFREGVVTEQKYKDDTGSYVDVGLTKPVLVDKCLVPGVRVTVRLCPPEGGSRKYRGRVVAPATPKAELGIYWGYTVRVADSLSKLFSGCPFPGGYDLTVGTSDRGQPVDEIGRSLGPFSHCLVAFGSLRGLEAALESDESLDMEDVALLFDHYLNMCPAQGSRTIRTEEAVLITLAELRRFWS